MTPEEKEILPCPFCGKPATWRKTKMKHCQLHGEPYQDEILGCFHKNCVGPSLCKNIRDHAIDAWNKRA